MGQITPKLKEQKVVSVYQPEIYIEGEQINQDALKISLLKRQS